MSAPRIADGMAFTLQVPSSWIELEVQPSRRDRTIEQLVSARTREAPELRPYRGALTQLLQEQSRRAWEAGAAYVALTAEPTDEGPVTASAVVMVVPGPIGVADDDPERLDVMASPFVPRQPEGPDDSWRRVEIVDVPGIGDAVRVSGVDDVMLPEQEGAVRVVMMQTLVPLPDGQVLLLTCSSPALDFADDLLDLFDALSGTLQVRLGVTS